MPLTPVARREHAKAQRAKAATYRALVLFGLLLARAVASAAAQNAFFVAVNGNDAWSGRLPAPDAQQADGPFATLEAARNAIRQIKKSGGLPPGGVTVNIQAGAYWREQAFELTPEDSGAEKAPIVYRSAGREPARILGGKPVTGFGPVEDPAILRRLAPEARANVQVADLRAQGITDYGRLPQWGAGRNQKTGTLELFFGAAMQLARWPNEGFVHIAEVIDKRDSGKFRYAEDRPQRWTGEPDPWLHGYWYNDWDDQYVRIGQIDTANRLLTVHPDDRGRGYGYKKGQRYYALNLLCELDAPGEYYLDRDAGRLYFWPPAPTTRGEIAVSTLNDLIRLRKDTSFIVLQGLLLEYGRGTAVTISGGQGNRVEKCVIRNMGAKGVSVRGGKSNGVVGCDIHAVGDGAIQLDGGDRAKLLPAANYAVNNHLHDFNRWDRTYKPGVNVRGVGQRVAHNLIHDAPHNAILLGGNNHLIAFNDIHSACYECGDVGAFYTGRDWTARGTLIRCNYFHHIRGPGRFGAIGVYLDDAACGFTIEGNVFYDVTQAAFVGGGRDNKVLNNVFVDCSPAVHVDSRMRLKDKYGAHALPGGSIYEKLMKTPYKEPPWSTTYPELVNILEDEWEYPKGTLIAHNVCWGGKWDHIDKHARPHVVLRDNLLDRDPLFVDAANLDFRLKPDSPAFQLGFKRIPVEKIGLLNDGARASWPVRHQPRPRAKAPHHNARAGARPSFRVARAAGLPEVDGTIRPGEWAADTMVLERNVDHEKAKPVSRAWLLHDGTALYVAVDNELSGTPPNPEPSAAVREKGPLRIGRSWGRHDATEIAIRNAPPGKPGEVLVLRGFASGHFETSDEPGTEPLTARRAAEDVRYAVRIQSQNRWTAEWRIPFASLGIDPTKKGPWPFNLTVRKPAGDLWLMWQGTAAQSWAVEKAGCIVLE
ncbi:MAG: right-handed parallel beta-helix repeat-containing protein [Kiritimatiellae bacterium]|nr:right-handed parallel beta-helix repeat-containing protein [Kiritimatiellia bacterium]